MKVSNLYPKQIFLIDAIGAIISAVLLGFVLVRYESTFGMPQVVLIPLAVIASVFACYSMFYAFRTTPSWPQSMKCIAFANSAYCLLTMGLILLYWQVVTKAGIGYFIIEIILISLIARLEFRKAAESERSLD